MLARLDAGSRGRAPRPERSRDPQSVHHPDDRVPDRLQHLSADLLARLLVHRFPRLGERAGQLRRPAELPRAARRRVRLEQLHASPRSTCWCRSAGRCWSASAWRCCSTAAIRGKGLLTTLLLLPMMMSMAVVGLFWQLLYSPSWGIINYVLRLEDFAWLSDPDVALYAVALTDIWMWSPFVMLLSLAGLSAIPQHLYEAAAIDRAGRWYTFTRITLPLVTPLLLIAIIFRTMEAFKTFDLAFIMTSMDDDRADRDPPLQDGVPGMADRALLRARLHRADHGAGHHQHLREVPQPGEGALSAWLPYTSKTPPRCWNRVADRAGVRACCVIYLLPLYWISSTAFKPRSLATTVPPTVFFQPEITAVRQAVHHARADARRGRTPRTTPRRPGGRSWCCDSRRALHQGRQRQHRELGLLVALPQQHHHRGDAAPSWRWRWAR